MGKAADLRIQRSTQPNVVVVLSDQQRPDSCGIYGQTLPVTPVLDELAGRGVVFDEAFTVQPLCGPSRAALQTGIRPTTLGCWRNGLALPTEAETLATRLEALGYQTGYIGKWHLASDRGPRLPATRAKARFERLPVPEDRRGGYRDVWVGADALEMTTGPYDGHVFDERGDQIQLEGFRVDALTDVAIDRLDRFDNDRPFLLFVSYLEPHHQNNRFRTLGPKGWAKTFASYEIPGDLAGWRGDWRWNYAEYLACCASIDANLGRLLDAVQARNPREESLVVYSSDHGNHFRTRNIEYKRTGHDASIRIPLVVSGPGFSSGARCDAFATNLDLVPTLVTAAGGPNPGLDGRPLQDAVVEVGSSVKEDVLIQISESHIGRALRTRTHTICVKATTYNPLAGHLHKDASNYRVTHLYDNTIDPHQRTNLAYVDKDSSIRHALVTTLADRIQAAEGRRPTIE